MFRLSCGNPVFLLWGWRAYLAVSRFYRYRVEDLLRFSNRNGGWSAVPVLTTVYEVPRRVGLGACGVSVWERVVELVGIIRLFLRVDSEPCSVFELLFDMQPCNCTRRSLWLMRKIVFI